MNLERAVNRQPGYRAGACRDGAYHALRIHHEWYTASRTHSVTRHPWRIAWRIEFLEFVRVTFEVEVANGWKRGAGKQRAIASEETRHFRKMHGDGLRQT